MNFTIFILVMCLPLLAVGSWFESDTYEDCILNKMKGVTSDVAAKEIKKACREKHPYKNKKTAYIKQDVLVLGKVRVQVPDEIVKMLSGNASFTDSKPYITGVIENKSKSWVIDQVEYIIYPTKKEWEKSLTKTCRTMSRYSPSKGDLYLMPGQSMEISGCDIDSNIGGFMLIDGAEYQWYISNAWGINLED